MGAPLECDPLIIIIHPGCTTVRFYEVGTPDGKQAFTPGVKGGTGRAREANSYQSHATVPSPALSTPFRPRPKGITLHVIIELIIVVICIGQASLLSQVRLQVGY